ncbi:hypothetical protein BCR34DRAFT_566784 [Clohesyomyces aquaticus]|uniref:Uncharacterized protein n=1 Tax=Clohesyomyces aquaticus TaxID=1231657 RepID=A0A1Y1ZJQ3_9PLEO|nr:hypothetical protein BCR34DRAFT_566784 [Clohesyomyces aquaticus]
MRKPYFKIRRRNRTALSDTVHQVQTSIQPSLPPSNDLASAGRGRADHLCLPPLCSIGSIHSRVRFRPIFILGGESHHLPILFKHSTASTESFLVNPTATLF